MSISAPEVIRTTEKRVACDGGQGALGHPMVYLDMTKEGKVVCPYCDRLFILKGGAADTAKAEA